jgi:hypothetical protein
MVPRLCLGFGVGFLATALGARWGVAFGWAGGTAFRGLAAGFPFCMLVALARGFAAFRAGALAFVSTVFLASILVFGAFVGFLVEGF